MKKSLNELSHLDNELHHIYNHVNDMLKFAEAKNAGLIAFNIAVIIGISQLNFVATDNLLLKYGGWYIVILNIISVFFSLISIFAQLRTKERIPSIDPSNNLLYFGTLALLSPEELLNQMKTRYKFISTNEVFELDMARQIIIVSQITLRKFRLFNIAMFFTFASIPPIPVFSFVFERWFNPNN